MSVKSDIFSKTRNASISTNVKKKFVIIMQFALITVKVSRANVKMGSEVIA